MKKKNKNKTNNKNYNQGEENKKYIPEVLQRKKECYDQIKNLAHKLLQREFNQTFASRRGR